SAEAIVSEIIHSKRGLVFGLVGLALIAAAIVGLWLKFSGNEPPAPFRNIRITRLTSGGKIGNASIKGYTSISPDGKYVVFRTTEAGRDSLWVRQVSTGSLVKIVPDSESKIGPTAFSRDGEFVYYSVFDNPL